MQHGYNCAICPRVCNIDRSVKNGVCGMGLAPVVAKAFLHMWEEPCISGMRGSGAVFFSGCNLKCVYCQNHEISHSGYGAAVSIERLKEIFLSLQEKGAHNINLVTPTHFTPQIREALLAAKQEGLEIPIVYNTNGYESMHGLKLMEGLADVYLPDIKYYSSEISLRYSGAPDYFEKASAAVLEMYRQVGAPVLDSEGIIKSGLIIRHLILPGHTDESIRILEWIRENLPDAVYVSLMSQYMPCHKAGLYPEIGRRITRREYDKVLNRFYKLGFENGYVQERDSAEKEYIPDFDLEGI